MGKNTMFMQNPNHNRTDFFYRYAAVHLMDFVMALPSLQPLTYTQQDDTFLHIFL